jgi:hypothetical protein
MRISSRCRFFNPEIDSIFYCGLDLGQHKDFTAFCVLERCLGVLPVYHVRYLKRFALGTSYPVIVGQIRKAIRHPAINPSLLLVDNTGVGIAVSDLFRQAKIDCVPITITGGDKVTRDGRSVRVPKRDLVSSLQVLFQTNRLKIAKGLSEAQALVDELLNFQVKISVTGHDTYGAWREGTHDDLLLALALCCWAAERKLLPKGFRWLRPSSGRKPLYPKRASYRLNSGLFNGPKINLNLMILSGD